MTSADFIEIETEKDQKPIIPTLDECPVYHVFDKGAEINGRYYKAGVHWFYAKEKDGKQTMESKWICSPLYIMRKVCDKDDNNHGRLLEFLTHSNKWKSWAMPLALLGDDGRELRKVLLSMGLGLNISDKGSLLNYIESQQPASSAPLLCVDQTGWHNKTFLLPNGAIGKDADNIVLQHSGLFENSLSQKGTLEDWRAGVAAMANGNPLLTLALSAGFAGALVAPCQGSGGGIHFVGDSSTGKTALIEAACSIWGGEDYKRSWRATANGIEGVAASFNDGLLALDEISECAPKDVGAIIYSIANGVGKQRANRNGEARPAKRWRCVVLSNGERSIESAMLEGGTKAKAGQVVRLLDVWATRQYGAWDNLQDYPNGAVFTDTLKHNARNHHGVAGVTFLEHLAADYDSLLNRYGQVKALPVFQAGDGQHKRAAARFALIAFAGELATEYGLTGWAEGQAIEAAAGVLREWVAERGQGSDERDKALTAMADFIDQHGDSRFSDMETEAGAPVYNRAGWWRPHKEGRLYLVNASGMREALTGQDFKQGLRHLSEAGAIIDQSHDKRAKTHRIGGRLMKLYTIDPEKLALE